MAKQHYFYRCRSKFLVLVGVLLVLGSACLVWGAEDKADLGPARNMSRALRHISAQQGKAFLSELEAGTVSQLGKSKMLLITGQYVELVKAKAVLDLVDSKEEYVIRVISPASAAPRWWRLTWTCR